jgi:FAD synthase
MGKIILIHLQHTFSDIFFYRKYTVTHVTIQCFLANYPEEVINRLPEGLDTGVYYGWASLDGTEVYKMVLSVGWNPFFKNTKKSMVGWPMK